MIAFEISVNGRQVQTVAVGDFGKLSAGVMWMRIKTHGDTIHEEFRTYLGGIESTTYDTVHWPYSDLVVGDAVTIRIVDGDGLCDPPSQRVSLTECERGQKLQNPK